MSIRYHDSVFRLPNANGSRLHSKSGGLFDNVLYTIDNDCEIEISILAFGSVI